MVDLKTKSDPHFKCNLCDKPYVKNGALTNHMKKVHLIIKSPVKTSFMDISTDDEMDSEKTFMADVASKKDTEMKHMAELARKNYAEEAAADELFIHSFIQWVLL
jgi:hypothetical protein